MRSPLRRLLADVRFRCERWRLGQSAPTGRLGEAVAARHLRREGYRVLVRNWRGRTGELDLIAERRGLLLIVEVKTRSGGVDPQAAAAGSVGPEKQRRIARAASEWLASNRYAVRRCRQGWSVRLDVIAVVVTGDGWSAEHIAGAFESPR